MARLCIRLLANDHPSDASLNAGRTHPGDVVSMVDDDHVWSPGELACGQYRFIDLPGVPQEDLEHLVKAKVEVILGGVEPEEREVARRAVKIDVDKMPKAQKVITKNALKAFEKVK